MVCKTLIYHHIPNGLLSFSTVDQMACSVLNVANLNCCTNDKPSTTNQ